MNSIRIVDEDLWNCLNDWLQTDEADGWFLDSDGIEIHYQHPDTNHATLMFVYNYDSQELTIHDDQVWTSFLADKGMQA